MQAISKQLGGMYGAKIVKHVSSENGVGAREIFSLVWLSIKLIFYIEILLYITADIKSKRPFGAIVAPQPL
jgi:hypothetical protein